MAKKSKKQPIVKGEKLDVMIPCPCGSGKNIKIAMVRRLISSNYN